ncbi:hypothetical protein FOL47_008370 [Perkinsus chesapeaki]|uniref:Uncharacterized protein n=1 Tax=Perkinsus chesapeaki TaxID=330153 RepID=A0A7J6LEM6_PERCH|nr:hypothetical protein FOL47_008370 [Perkinsus chesapeaki]
MYMASLTSGTIYYTIKLDESLTRINTFTKGRQVAVDYLIYELHLLSDGGLMIGNHPDVIVLPKKPKTCKDALETVLKMGVQVAANRANTPSDCDGGRPLVTSEVAMKRVEDRIRSTEPHPNLGWYEPTDAQGLCYIISDLYNEIEEVILRRRSSVRLGPQLKCELTASGDSGDFYLSSTPNDGIMAFRKDSTWIIPTANQQANGETETQTCEEHLSNMLRRAMANTATMNPASFWGCQPSERSRTVKEISLMLPDKKKSSNKFRGLACSVPVLDNLFSDAMKQHTAITLELDTKTCEFTAKIADPMSSRGPQTLRLQYNAKEGGLYMIGDGGMRLYVPRTGLTHITLGQDAFHRELPMPNFKDCKDGITSLLRIGAHLSHSTSIAADNLEAIDQLVHGLGTSKHLDGINVLLIPEIPIYTMALFDKMKGINRGGLASIDESASCSLQESYVTHLGDLYLIHLHANEDARPVEISTAYIPKDKRPTQEANMKVNTSVVGNCPCKASTILPRGSCQNRLATTLYACWGCLVHQSTDVHDRMLYKELEEFAHQQIVNEAKSRWSPIDWMSPQPRAYRIVKHGLTTDILHELVGSVAGNEENDFGRLREKSTIDRERRMKLSSNPGYALCELRLKDEKDDDIDRLHRLLLDHSFRILRITSPKYGQGDVRSLEKHLAGKGLSRFYGKVEEPQTKSTEILCKLAFIHYLEAIRLLPEAKKYLDALPGQSPGFTNIEGIEIHEGVWHAKFICRNITLAVTILCSTGRDEDYAKDHARRIKKKGSDLYLPCGIRSHGRSAPAYYLRLASDRKQIDVFRRDEQSTVKVVGDLSLFTTKESTSSCKEALKLYLEKGVHLLDDTKPGPLHLRLPCDDGIYEVFEKGFITDLLDALFARASKAVLKEGKAITAVIDEESCTLQYKYNELICDGLEKSCESNAEYTLSCDKETGSIKDLSNGVLALFTIPPPLMEYQTLGFSHVSKRPEDRSCIDTLGHFLTGRSQDMNPSIRSSEIISTLDGLVKDDDNTVNIKVLLELESSLVELWSAATSDIASSQGKYGYWMRHDARCSARVPVTEKTGRLGKHYELMLTRDGSVKAHFFTSSDSNFIAPYIEQSWRPAERHASEQPRAGVDCRDRLLSIIKNAYDADVKKRYMFKRLIERQLVIESSQAWKALSSWDTPRVYELQPDDVASKIIIGRMTSLEQNVTKREKLALPQRDLSQLSKDSVCKFKVKNTLAGYFELGIDNLFQISYVSNRTKIFHRPRYLMAELQQRLVVPRIDISRSSTSEMCKHVCVAYLNAATISPSTPASIIPIAEWKTIKRTGQYLESNDKRFIEAMRRIFDVAQEVEHIEVADYSEPSDSLSLK